MCIYTPFSDTSVSGSNIPVSNISHMFHTYQVLLMLDIFMIFRKYQTIYIYTYKLYLFIPGWWLGHPSEKYEFVNWDDYSQYMGKCQKWQPNHQPEIIRSFNFLAFHLWQNGQIHSSRGSCSLSRMSIYTGWWFEPLWKILVNWDDYSQYIGK